MKKILIILSLAALAVGCCSRNARNQGPEIPFDPADVLVISEDVDKMAHCSVFLPDGNGTVYFAYYHDTVQTLENPEKTSIEITLAKSSYPDFNSFERVDVMRAGQAVGDFVQSPDRAPYDPNLLLLGDTLMLYFVGCVDGVVTTCVRPYDTRSGTFADKVDVCTLEYDGKTVPFDTKHIFDMFAEKGLEATFNNDLLMSGSFVLYDGAWYSSFGNAFLKRSCPVIVKTVDGRHFEYVMHCPEFLFGCCETSIAIWKDEFYVIMRNSGVERGGRGIYIARYDASGNCLTPPRYLTEAQAKPAIILHDGRLFIFYNANPFLYTDWGLVSRSRFRIAEIDRDCNILWSRDVTDPYGIHYPYVHEMDGNVWMTFTEDRKQLDINQTRSNISFTKVEL